MQVKWQGAASGMRTQIIVCKCIALIFLISGCSPSRPEDFRAEGEGHFRALAALLRTVDTKEDLHKLIPALRQEFLAISALVVEVRAYQKAHPEAIWNETPSPVAEELFIELARLYEIPGCRALIEKAQADAALKL
jgi:hypothetical protein